MHVSKPVPNNKARKAVDKVSSPLQKFFALEASGGILLFVAAVAAMIMANSSALSEFYNSLITTPVVIGVGTFALEKNLLLLVNDGLMAIFFFVVGLEIKREILVGELSSIKKASFSIFAAIGGMAIPALIYFSMNGGSESASGWGIPMATDIAFALGVLTLFGKRAPLPLKIFLLALAIIDDLGAILIIAIFYSSNISMTFLGGAFVTLGLLFFLNHVGFRNIGLGIVFGLITWFFFLKSGIHATIAGVLLAFITPAYGVREDGEIDKEGPLFIDQHIHSLHSWVAFVIMPIFAFFNAGVGLAGVDIGVALTSNVSLGIILGLLIGKPVGVFLFAYGATKLGWSHLPQSLNWKQVFAVGLLAGIGFTMSLFINSLAFTNPQLVTYAKLGIITASAIAMVLGAGILHMSLPALRKES